MSPSIRHLFTRSLSLVGIFFHSRFAHPDLAGTVVEDKALHFAWLKGLVGFVALVIVCAGSAVLGLSATPASAQTEWVPVNGCFQGSEWGWARREDKTQIDTSGWDSFGPGGGCGSHRFHPPSTYPDGNQDKVYSSPVLVGDAASLTLSFYRASGSGPIGVDVFDLDTFSRTSLTSITTGGTGAWYTAQRDLSIFERHRVILSFYYQNPDTVYISNVSVSNSTNAPIASPGNLNGPFNWNPTPWWSAHVQYGTGVGGPMYDGSVGHLAAGSSKQQTAPANVANNWATYPFVANGENMTFWARGSSNFSAGIRVQVLDFGQPGTSGDNVVVYSIPSGYNLGTTWASFSFTIPSKYTGHTVSLLFMVDAPN